MGAAYFCCKALRSPFLKKNATSCFGRLFMPRFQIFDALSTFCGRKYGRLDVIQNPERNCLQRNVDIKVKWKSS